MKSQTIFTAIFFGVGLAAALTIENVFSGTALTLRNISAHVLAGIVGGIVFGFVIGFMRNRNKSDTK